MDGEIAEHNNIMLAKIIILYEKQLELEDLNPDTETRDKRIQLSIDRLGALITKYKQKIVRDDK